MKLLSAALLGVLTSGVIASESSFVGHFYFDAEGRRRPRPPKKSPPKKSPPKGKSPKGPSKGRPAKTTVAPTRKPRPTLRPTRKPKRTPSPTAPARPNKRPSKGRPTKPPRRTTTTQAPPPKRGKKPCRGKWCKKPCWPNCVEMQANHPELSDTVEWKDVLHKELPQHKTDDVYYPKTLLKSLADSGVDISGMLAIPGTIDAPQAGRGLSTHSKWTVRDSDGKITVPYSFHANYPADCKAAAIAALDQMNGDLGCLKTLQIQEADLATTSWTNGVFMVYENLSGGGCYSALGKAPGYTGRAPGISSITELGAPSGWQLMSYGSMAVSSCTCDDPVTVMHEFMHAMGVKHEHSRPDRDQFLNVNLDATTSDDQFALINTASWIQVFGSDGTDLYPYETASAMHYCSLCGSSDGVTPVMTYKDGTIFGDGPFMTTTDSLQLIWSYCDAEPDQGNPKDTITCPTGDKFNVIRPVYTDRLCDGRNDCFNGEDEASESGGMARCIPEAIISGGVGDGCCATYIVGESEYIQGADYNGFVTFVDSADPNLAILKWWDGTWKRLTTGVPSGSGGISYNAETLDDSWTGTCPPPAIYQLGSNAELPINCKNSGFELLNLVDECADGTDNCVASATCTDTISAFTCTCPDLHTGDGTTSGTGCTEIILEDECANGNNNCPSVCTDQQEGFTCSCTDAQFDVNGDGLTCLDVEPCCLRFKFGLNSNNYRMVCEWHHEDELGFYEYTCSHDPDFPNSETSGFNFPSSVQYVDNFIGRDPGYFFIHGQGIPFQSGESISIMASAAAPNGANCPDMNPDVWEPKQSWSDWLIECLEFEVVEEPADPDQCADGSNNCSNSATCTNTDTGFTCACLDGFTGDGVTCTALVNECESGVANCDPNAFCNDMEVGFSCVCNDGFDGDGFNCQQIDVNECADDALNTCNPIHGTCENSQSGFSCACFDGFEPDASGVINCVDVNECQLQALDACSVSSGISSCENTDGGFECACQNGYEADPNATTANFACLDVNECTNANNPCGQNSICNNNDGGFTCSCQAGYSADASGACVDLNECDLQADICNVISSDVPNLGSCSNFAGGFSCLCADGYQGNGYETFQGEEFVGECTDIDECDANDPNDVCRLAQGNPASCDNTEGAFTCTCNSGFEHTDNQIDCMDVDECANDICNIASNGEPAACANFDGGWQCECDHGYIASTDQPTGPFRSESDFHCIDIDECLLSTTCNLHIDNPATCTNTAGGFECNCLEGFSADSSGICITDNHCENDPCGIDQGNQASCANIDGGFECICNDGFAANAAGTCEDIDECADANANVCSFVANENMSVCTNTEGGFECSCEPGFTMNAAGHCEDIDECNLFRMRVSCGSFTECVNTWGSFDCFCLPGFELVETEAAAACVDIDECTSENSPCDASALCTNSNGDFSCSCPPGTHNTGQDTNAGIVCAPDDVCAGVTCEAGKVCVDVQGDAICDDINECLEDGVCTAQNTQCNNMNPGFSCDCVTGTVPGPNGLDAGCFEPCEVANCEAGFTCEDGECLDIDECATNQSPCPENSVCQNSSGGFNCDCFDGFNAILDPQTEATVQCEASCDGIECPLGTTCSIDEFGPWCWDIDECAEAAANGNAICDPDFECANVDCGEGECDSNGSGFECLPIEEPTVLPPVNEECEPNCPVGFTCVVGSCFDINECALPDACHTFETCTNTEGSYECSFDPSTCPSNKALKEKFRKKGKKNFSFKNGSPVAWQPGTKFGKLKFQGEDHFGLQVKVLRSDFVDVRNSPYYAFLAFGRLRCGKKFQAALANGDITVDVMDRQNVYDVIDVYHRDDASQSITSIMVNLHDTSTKDLPLKKGKPVQSMDYMYLFFRGIDQVEWGNKNWKQCLQKMTVGAIQDAEDPFFSHACAIWNKNGAH